MTSSTAVRIPEPLRSYLADACLAPLWAAMRSKLERNRLSPTGIVRVELDEEGTSRLGGLLGTRPAAGTVSVRLPLLDHALRVSAAQCGLLTAVTDLTGSPLTDRVLTRQRQSAARADLWARIDARLADAGLAAASWVPTWLEGLRTTGMLTRAGSDTAWEAADGALRALALLRTLPLHPAEQPDVPPREWQLAELAAHATADGHGLDEGRLAGILVLRAIAAACDIPLPESSAARRRLWERVSVTTDVVSGTVMVWHLNPPGDDPWSTMMRSRSQMHLVTHLTMHELGAASAATLVPPDASVHGCENPQVLQATARQRIPTTLICPSGNPAGAGWELLGRLRRDGARLSYHGDFDWPGLAIAARIFALGAAPWRMGSSDYRDALTSIRGDHALGLSGPPTPSHWDPALATSMTRAGVAIHEEALLPLLLNDLYTAAHNGS
ncbi:TIGR02679 family protein [Actinacidiphila yanglinensis]|uniref:TIGR02679 family protein n=1 Tax=Actinacidiphila yanglinensis TaxID=310779 RepID=A0A1H6DIK6_9ACTN|nr:TIGR02679 family protein [Actinacidiphila yanglinensis]SEG85267.1 TIGR02679 family protein [Actinacidiphila yanglinensis]SEG91073.1 TIGR02679 family protein [Actinacidiphila yanglinensis]